MPDSSDRYNINYEDVEESVHKDDRIILRVPGFCIVVMDENIIGEGWCRQFEDNPYGYDQAMRWAVRLADEDIEDKRSVEELRTVWDRELGFTADGEKVE